MKLRELVNAYMACYRGRDPSLHSRLAYWVDRLGDLELIDLDADLVDSEMANLAQRGKQVHVRGKGVICTGTPLSPATLNRYLVALSSVYSWAKKRRLVPRAHVSPTKGVDKLTESDGRTVYLSDEQVERVIACAAMSSWQKLPALVRLAFTTGLRKSALTGLRWKDVDLVAGRAYVARTKNGQPHVAALTPATVIALQRMPGHRVPDGLIFSGKDEVRAHDFRKAWENACRDAGLGHVPFHVLRHSCASHLAKRGSSPLFLADTLGHKSLRTVMRYAHLGIDDRAREINQAFA